MVIPLLQMSVVQLKLFCRNHARQGVTHHLSPIERWMSRIDETEMHSCCTHLPSGFTLRTILGMYFIERRGGDRQWIRELNFKTEFKALIGARRKAISNLATYRVVHALWPNQVVCYVDGPELANEVEPKG